MSKEMGVVVLGVFVVILPYLGIPASWHTFFTVVAGIALVVLGFLLRGEALGRGPNLKEHRGRHAFVENIPERQADIAVIVEEEVAYEPEDTLSTSN